MARRESEPSKRGGTNPEKKMSSKNAMGRVGEKGHRADAEEREGGGGGRGRSLRRRGGERLIRREGRKDQHHPSIEKGCGRDVWL